MQLPELVGQQVTVIYEVQDDDGQIVAGGRVTGKLIRVEYLYWLETEQAASPLRFSARYATVKRADMITITFGGKKRGKRSRTANECEVASDTAPAG